jgi:hypothetical protein
VPFHISLPSVQSLFVEIKARGLLLGNGTGFVVESSSGRSFFVTNRHIVTGRHQLTDQPLDTKTGAVPDELVVWHNSTLGLGLFQQVSVPLQQDGQATWVEHPTLGASADIVAIEVPATSDVRLLPYRTDALIHNRMHPSQRISVVGFPFGERTGQSFAVWATGFIASEPELNHGGKPVFLIDCRTREGQSGSPVIRHEEIGALFMLGDGANKTEAETELLGIYSGRINDKSDIGVVWKTYAIAELVLAASLGAA